MRPIRLQLKNFMSYEAADVDLGGVNLGVVVGVNGSGKSTLLLAMTYALWGQVRTASHNDVVRRGQSSCAVSLDFEAGGVAYRVLRRRDLSGRGSSDLELSLIEDGQVVAPLTGPTIRDTQAEIEKLVGPYEVFANSAFLMQGDASRFSDARPGERKELLATMLGLDWFQRVEKLARQEVRRTEDELKGSAVVLDVARDSLLALAGLDKESAEKEVASAQVQLEQKEQEVWALRTQQSELRDLIKQLESARVNLDDYELRLAEIENDVDDLRDEEARLHHLIRHGDSIGEQKRLSDELKASLPELEKIGTEAAGLRAIASEWDQLVLEREQNTVYEEDVERLTEMESKIEVCEGDVAALTEQAKTLQGYLGKANNRVHEASWQATELEKRLKLLEGNYCPTCEQAIQDPAMLFEHLERELESAKSVVRDESKFIDKLTQEIKESEKCHLLATAKLDALKKGWTDLRESIIGREVALKNIEFRERKVLDATTKLRELQGDLEKLGTTKAQLAKLEGIDAEYERLSAAEDRLNQISIELEKLDRRWEKGTDLVGETEKEIGRLEVEIAKYDPIPDIESALSLAETVLVALRGSLREAEAELTRIDTELARKAKLEAQAAEYESKIGQLELDLATAKLLVEATGKTGAPALLIEAALPQIEKDANEYLASMAQGMELRLESQRLTQAGSASETLEIRVVHSGLEAPIESLSGGERFRADLCLRLAIGKMLARRSGIQIKCLALDEGFGTQDSDGQDAIISVVSGLSKLFGLILIVTHVRSVSEAIAADGSLFTVEKQQGRSVVR